MRKSWKKSCIGLLIFIAFFISVTYLYAQDYSNTLLPDETSSESVSYNTPAANYPPSDALIFPPATLPIIRPEIPDELTTDNIPEIPEVDPNTIPRNLIMDQEMGPAGNIMTLYTDGTTLLQDPNINKSHWSYPDGSWVIEDSNSRKWNASIMDFPEGVKRVLSITDDKVTGARSLEYGVFGGKTITIEKTGDVIGIKNKDGFLVDSIDMPSHSEESKIENLYEDYRTR